MARSLEISSQKSALLDPSRQIIYVFYITLKFV
jgi:hypothetical protein